MIDSQQFSEWRSRSWATWFNPNARWSLPICRLFLSSAVLWTLMRCCPPSALRALAEATDPSSYKPVGLLALVSPSPPSADWVVGWWWVALVSSLGMALGVFTRASIAVSAFSTLIPCSYVESFHLTGWSHWFNIVLLAQLAFLPARAGEDLSVDSLVRPTSSSERAGNRGAIHLVQFSLGLVFLNAFFWKLWHSGLTWALSDNMRCVLLLQYPSLGRELPSYLVPVLKSEILYKGLALGNLVAQASPALGVLFLRRPLLRAACGALMGLEICALGLVMSIWNPNWLPLVAFFVDWDALIGALGKEQPDPPRPDPPAASSLPTLRSAAYPAFYAAFSTLIAFSAWEDHLDYRLNVYPFTSFQMYSALVVKPPYDVHLPYRQPVIGVRVKGGSPPLPELAKLERTLNRHFCGIIGIERAEDIKARLHEARQIAIKSGQEWLQVELWRAVMLVPAYPKDPEPSLPIAGLMGTISRQGEIQVASLSRGWDAKRNQHYLVLDKLGRDLSETPRVSYVVDHTGPLRPLRGRWEDGRYYYTYTEHGYLTFMLDFPSTETDYCSFFYYH